MSVSNMIQQEMNTDEFWAGIAKLGFITALNKIMEEQNISRTELAQRIGKSPAYITKVMSGDANLTIESMVMFSRSVGMRFHPEMHPEKPSVKTITLPTIHYITEQDDTLVKCYG